MEIKLVDTHIWIGRRKTYVLSEEPFRFAIRFREIRLEHDLLVFALLGVLINQRFQETFRLLRNKCWINVNLFRFVRRRTAVYFRSKKHPPIRCWPIRKEDEESKKKKRKKKER